MRLTTAVRYRLARWLYKSSGFAIVPRWFTRSFLEPSWANLVREGYQRNAVYFACIEALAFSFPEPPLLVWEDESDDAAQVPNHPLRKLLRKPNADMGEAELHAAIITWMAIGGNAYLHKGRNSRGQVVELRPYHDGQITPVAASEPDAASWIDHYELSNGTDKPTDIPREDIVHIKWPALDPKQPWMAQPPILAAAREVDSDNEASRYVTTLLKNDAVPRTIVKQSTQRFMNDDEVRRAKAQFKENYGGDNLGGVLILEAGADIERLSLNMEELNFAALHDIPEQRICAVMKVPAVVAGLGDDPTYANSEQAWLRFTLATLVPLWRTVSSEIQADLAPEFGNGVAVRHNLAKVQALQENEDAKWGRVDKAFTSGYLGFYESRAMLGLGDPRPDELFRVTVAASLEPADAVLNPESAPTSNAVPKQLPAPSAPILGYHIESGVVSRNEARAQLGLPPEDETTDDRLRRLQGLLTVAQVAVNVGIDMPDALRLVGLDPVLAAPAVPPQLPAPPKTKARMSPAKLVRALQKVRAASVKRMEKAVDRFFAGMADRVVARIGKAWGLVLETKADLPGLDDLIKDDDWLDLEKTIKRYYVEVLESSWPFWNDALGAEVAFELSDPAVVKVLKTAGSRVTLIDDATRAELQDLFSHAADQGWTLDQLVRGDEDTPGLRSLITETYKGRARAIARTELGTAQQIVAVDRYDEAGVKRVVVFDGGSDDSDDECNQLNSTTQTLAWARANPLGHTNCVRTFGPSFE